jgi:8-oxo-dGTP pyrophosphatase MutT (NUDIX family)
MERVGWHDIRAALQSRPPGRIVDPVTARAAVAVVLRERAGAIEILFIRRAEHPADPWSGQMAFPGGRAEPGDADPEATALREAAEEVGLDPSAADVRVVGHLEPFWIPVSDYQVTPVLAIAGRRPVLVASPSEVARIVEAPLGAFLPAGPIEIVEAVVRDWPLRYGAYPVEGLKVWGATARILGQLGALLAD